MDDDDHASIVSWQLKVSGYCRSPDEKKLPGVKKLRLENFAKGVCAQILHVGPLSEEGPTVAPLHEFIDTRTGRSGKHHEPLPFIVRVKIRDAVFN